MFKLICIVVVVLIGLVVLLVVIVFMIGCKFVVFVIVVLVVYNEMQVIIVVEVVVCLFVGELISVNGLCLVQCILFVFGVVVSIVVVIGKVLVQDIVEGSVINSSVLVQGFLLQLWLGECVLVVFVDELVGVGNCIFFGDFVDVFFNLCNVQFNINGFGEVVQMCLLLLCLCVLSYGQQDIVLVVIEIVFDSGVDICNDLCVVDIIGSGSMYSSSNEVL